MKRLFEVGESSRSGERRRQEREPKERWPGWPGYNVFRFIVPKRKVGRIIGVEGETVRRICQETAASVHVFQRRGASFYDSVVLVSGREEPHRGRPSAMLGAFEVFKLITGFSTSEDDSIGSPSDHPVECCIRLLVHSDHMDYLIGRQEDALKLIQEKTNVNITISSVAAIMWYYVTEDEQVIVMNGEVTKVRRALKSLLGELRKFLVDREVLPMFESKYYEATSQAFSAVARDDSFRLGPFETSFGLESSLPLNLDCSACNFHSGPFETSFGSESSLPLNSDCSGNNGKSYIGTTTSQPELPIHDQNPGLGHTATPMFHQINYEMEVPLEAVERIIGKEGDNINYVRRTSKAITNVELSIQSADMATVKIKGTISQIQMVQHLIQDFIDNYLVIPTPNLRSSQYSEWQSSAKPNSGSSQYSEWQSSHTTSQPNSEFIQYSGWQSSDTDFQSNSISDLYSEWQSRDVTTQPNIGSIQYSGWQSPDRTFQPNSGSSQYSEWRSPNTTTQPNTGSIQYSGWQLLDTTFQHNSGSSQYTEWQLPDTTSQPNSGSIYSAWQSPDATFQPNSGSSQYFEWHSSKTTFQPNSGSNQYSEWQWPNTTFQPNSGSNQYFEMPSPDITFQPNSGSSQYSEWQSSDPTFQPGYFEMPSPDITFQPNPGSSQYSEWQSSDPTFQPGSNIYSVWQSSDTTFQPGSSQYSESQSPDTTFCRSPSFSWYLNENESNRFGGHSDERWNAENISLTCDETKLDIEQDPDSFTFSFQ